jgi:hypothetical protein
VSPHRDLRLVALAAVASGGLSLLIPVEALSIVLLAPLAFLLPGYALSAATLVRNRPEWPQTLVFSLGLSLAVLALGALPLNYLGGVTPGGWTLLLVAVTLAGCAIAARRRGAASGGAPRLPTLSRPSPLAAAAAGLGALAAAAAVVLAFVPLSATHAIGYTELWLLPDRAAATPTARIGVGNEEKEATSYLLTARFGGGRPAVERAVSLDPGETEVLELPAPPGPAGGPVFVRVDLARAEAPDRVYRQVYGWLPAAGESGG